MYGLPTMARLGALAGLLSLGWAGSASALNFEFLGADFSLQNKFTVGGGVRLEERDPDLIGKLNLNPELCPQDCQSFDGESGDPEPNRRLVRAPGAFLGHNADDGNLNFDQGDLISGQARLKSDLSVFWGDITFKLSTMGFYDAVNSNLDEFNPDNFNDVPPAPPNDDATAFQQRTNAVDDELKDRFGRDFDILEGFVNIPFEILGTNFDLTVGEQRVRWGEATFNVLNSLDVLNPPTQNRLHFPGSEIASVFEPTGMAVLSSNLTSNLSAELIWQYDWERVEPTAAGTFFSTNDIAGGGDDAHLTFSQVSEDPDQVGSFTNSDAEGFTSTSLSAPVIKGGFGFPDDDIGQYGGRINYFAENFNGGTEFSFYFMNYHSRLPIASTFATDRSCTRDQADTGIPSLAETANGLLDTLGLGGVIDPNQFVNEVSVDALTAITACGGFNGTSDQAALLQAAVPGESGEPTPVDTLRPFLEYPEDIRLFGTSFTTNIGKWSLAGEYSFRPNQPLQVQISDLLFAGLQPGLPEEDVDLRNVNETLRALGVSDEDLIDFPGGVIPGRRRAPDIVESQFRDNTVAPNQRIDGYEEFEVHQIDFTGLRSFGAGNYLFADQIIMLVELGMTYVDLPEIRELPIEAFFLDATHPSPGADGTGAPGGPVPQRINPTQQTENFPDDFSAGYRILIQPSYSNLLFGYTVNPTIAFLHDFAGISPAPIQNFVEDRKQVLLGAEVLLSQSLKGQLMYQGFFGGEFNNLEDRDNLTFSLSYNF